MIIYVLKLEDDKYYVGKTADLNRRKIQHFTGNGSSWTRKYKPLYLVETIETTDYFTELGVVLFYMSKYGIENVRGSTYSSVNLSKNQIREIEKHIRGEYNLCFKCGESSHFSKNCKKPGNCLSSLFSKIRFIWNRKNTINFGKYKGYSYSYISKNDKDYCEWVKSQEESNSEELKQFRYWLLAN